MEAIRARTSMSFTMAMVMVVLVGGGYVAWKTQNPGVHGVSDGVVRDFADALERDLGEFRRKVGKLLISQGPGANDLAAAVETVETLTAEALSSLETSAAEARRSLEALEDLPVRTLKNRLARVDKRVEEARRLVFALADTTKQRLSAGVSAPDTPGQGH